MKFLSSSLLAAVLLISGCFPKEEGIEPKPRNNTSVLIDAGVTKSDVAFYSLEQDSLVATTRADVWDFLFEEAEVKINQFRSLRVAEINDDWHNKLDTIGLVFSYLTNQNEKQWTLKPNQIYAVDYGVDKNFESLGLVKVMFEVDSEGTITLWHSPVESAFELVINVGKEGYYNLREQRFVELPLESEYDIAFGKYTDYAIFPDEEADYLIYGAILGSASAVSLNNSFDDVTAEALDSLTFPSLKTTIGWDWKSYNLDAGAYTVEEDRTYVIKNRSGYYYKLRFVNFYNENGVSGHPTFEYKLL